MADALVREHQVRKVEASRLGNRILPSLLASCRVSLPCPLASILPSRLGNRISGGRPRKQPASSESRRCAATAAALFTRVRGGVPDSEQRGARPHADSSVPIHDMAARAAGALAVHGLQLLQRQRANSANPPRTAIYAESVYI